MKHTKEEWMMSKRNDVGDIHIYAKGTPIIAIIPLRDVSYNEQTANGKLIVQSPKLLEALIKAEKFISEVIPMVRRQSNSALDSVNDEQTYNSNSARISSETKEDYQLRDSIRELIKLTIE